MGKAEWKIPRKGEIGAIIWASQNTPATEPRNTSNDPAFSSDFNLPLPDQHSPGATGIAVSTQPSTRDAVDVEGTPANEHLKELAASNPPPPQWLEGEEENLF